MLFGAASVAAGAVSVLELRRSAAEARELYGELLSGLDLIGELQYDVQEARRRMMYALTTADANLQVQYVDESRAAWLTRYAKEHGADLAASYGYGDSHADLTWLQLLGNANAVNPDLPLYRHAQEKRWNILDWKRGATPAPVANEQGTESPSDAEGAGSSSVR